MTFLDKVPCSKHKEYYAIYVGAILTKVRPWGTVSLTIRCTPCSPSVYVGHTLVLANKNHTKYPLVLASLTVCNPYRGHTTRSFVADNGEHEQEITFGHKNSVDQRNKHLHHV